MSTRILHCSTSIENYNICIEQKVAGFSNKGPQPDDLVYLAVKVGKKTLCGARFRLDKPTDFKPWADSEKYINALRLKEVEYCQPFDISILAKIGGAYWGIKYMQASKPILDQSASDLLDQEFRKNKVDLFAPYETKSASGEEEVVTPALTLVSEPSNDEGPLTRDSIKIQAMLAEIGARMDYKIWIPKSDRSRVFEVWQSKTNHTLKELPLNYDIDTIQTIENIDVLWIKGRSIIRAFEIEHTTSIYSGILRMADLMALQPNLNIKAHIVAPLERKGKVMQELSRPVFKHILAPVCTYISYNSIEELAKEKRLEYMSDDVLKEYSESAVDFTIL